MTPFAFAHRGGRDGGFRENSLEAFADALARGANLETDVRLDRDGDPVLVHDRRWRRVGLPSRVKRTTTKRLAAAKIPTLADLYRELGSDFELSIDIKVVAAGPATIEVARRAGARERMWLVHRSQDVLRSLRLLDDEVRLVQELPADAMRKAGAHAADRAMRLQGLGLNGENRDWATWTESEIAALHARGLSVFGSLVHKPEQLPDAAARGLDALYSDHVSALVDALANHAP
jgi:glycerophosphoryl diester phosphodiesterase